jgi:deoxyribodipyrimidine photo-lyase
MTERPDAFPASLAAAQERLRAFAPHAGAAYAERRNHDLGPGHHKHVSQLSPYLRLRLLDEVAVTRAVLAEQPREAAEKFLTEVFWRTYWKGWLELRPQVWTWYQADLQRLRDDLQTQSGLRRRWEAACLGKTGIAPFDAWAQELVQTHYLHNHARMWFASIWIFTLGLPWQLGADFFLRHLLDGDAASNTLGWRWVAGLQTRGKIYQATEENIRRYTGGRFARVPGLAAEAPMQEGPENPAPGDLPALPAFRPGQRPGLLLHSDDVDPAPLLEEVPGVAAWAYADATAEQTPWQMAPAVPDFRAAAARDRAPEGEALPLIEGAQALADWTSAQGLDSIVTPYAPVGPTQALFAAYRARPDALPLLELRRPLDSAAWPRATKGFFKFKGHIPELIDRFALAR